MVVIHCAYTEQINPSGTTPVLTRDQIWRGLQRKVRRAQDFVPVIEDCEVLEERTTDGVPEVVRLAHFKAMGDRPPTKVEEVCRSFYPTKIDFVQPSGAVITNTVSDGPGLTEHDYNMTYTFEWRFPDVAEGSSEAQKLAEQKVKEAQMAVHSSIVAMRKMAVANELDG